MNKEVLSVVIVDDEPIVRMDLKEILENTGYNVLAEAKDGFEAIEKCKEHHPDLVLMDIKMPCLDGITAARIIHDKELADTVILLSAYSEKKLVEEAKHAGVDGYLVKPIDEKSLIPSIELTVERTKKLKKTKLDMDDVCERLENRTIIEKAKGFVMLEEGISEQEAYEYIKKLSRDKALSMKRVAEVITIRHGINNE